MFMSSMDHLFGPLGRFGCFAVVGVILMGLVAVMIAFLGAPGRQILDTRQGQPNAPVPPPPAQYTRGTGTTTVTGDLALSEQLPVDEHASYTSPRGRSQISFTDYANPDSGAIFIALNEPGNYVSVEQGNTVALGQDDDCTYNIQASGTSLSGSVSCASVEVQTDGQVTGTASIQIQFSIEGVPWDGDDGGPDPYENAPTDEPPATE